MELVVLATTELSSNMLKGSLRLSSQHRSSAWGMNSSPHTDIPILVPAETVAFKGQIPPPHLPIGDRMRLRNPLVCVVREHLINVAMPRHAQNEALARKVAALCIQAVRVEETDSGYLITCRHRLAVVASLNCVRLRAAYRVRRRCWWYGLARRSVVSVLHWNCVVVLRLVAIQELV